VVHNGWILLCMIAFRPVVDLDDDQMNGFPLCSDPEKELPKHLAFLAKKGEMAYISTLEKEADNEYLLIRLLWLNK